MPELTNPHDKFFKEILSREEVARDFLKNYLPPEVYALINTDSLELSKDTFVDKDLTEYFSDLLYKADIKDGKSAYIQCPNEKSIIAEIIKEQDTHGNLKIQKAVSGKRSAFSLKWWKSLFERLTAER